MQINRHRKPINMKKLVVQLYIAEIVENYRFLLYFVNITIFGERYLVASR